jgi:hypothetical protein
MATSAGSQKGQFWSNHGTMSTIIGHYYQENKATSSLYAQVYSFFVIADKGMSKLDYFSLCPYCFLLPQQGRIMESFLIHKIDGIFERNQSIYNCRT